MTTDPLNSIDTTIAITDALCGSKRSVGTGLQQGVQKPNATPTRPPVLSGAVEPATPAEM